MYHLYAANPTIGGVEVMDGDSTYRTKKAARLDLASLVARWRSVYGMKVSGSLLAGYGAAGQWRVWIGPCPDAECVECRDWRRSVGVE